MEYRIEEIKELVIGEYGVEVDEVTDWIDENVRVYEDCFTMADVAQEWVDSIGSVKDAVYNWESYIDVDRVVRDLEIDGLFSELEYEAEQEAEAEGFEYEERFPTYESMVEFVEELIEDGSLGADFLERYFDYEAFGRDMEIEGTFYYMGLGVYVEIIA